MPIQICNNLSIWHSMEKNKLGVAILKGNRCLRNMKSITKLLYDNLSTNVIVHTRTINPKQKLKHNCQAKLSMHILPNQAEIGKTSQTKTTRELMFKKISHAQVSPPHFDKECQKKLHLGASRSRDLRVSGVATHSNSSEKKFPSKTHPRTPCSIKSGSTTKRRV